MEEPGGLKAYFVLRFRAVGKFLGKLMDYLGKGNVSAAGERYVLTSIHTANRNYNIVKRFRLVLAYRLNSVTDKKISFFSFPFFELTVVSLVSHA